MPREIDQRRGVPRETTTMTELTDQRVAQLKSLLLQSESDILHLPLSSRGQQERDVYIRQLGELQSMTYEVAYGGKKYFCAKYGTETLSYNIPIEDPPEMGMTHSVSTRYLANKRPEKEKETPQMFLRAKEMFFFPDGWNYEEAIRREIAKLSLELQESARNVDPSVYARKNETTQKTLTRLSSLSLETYEIVYNVAEMAERSGRSYTSARSRIGLKVVSYPLRRVRVYGEVFIGDKPAVIGDEDTPLKEYSQGRSESVLKAVRNFFEAADKIPNYR